VAPAQQAQLSLFWAWWRDQGDIPMKTDEANIGSAIPDMAARTELHSISTLTLTDTQFLRGDPSGKPTITSGQLRLPKGSGPMPVVVLQHGSAGMAPNVEMWTREFNRIGVATFALDGFTGRGLTDVNTNQALLGRLNFIVDIYRALDVLARHPAIDRTRIALMGFSRGGQATLYAGLVRFHRLWNTSGVEFAAYVPFYPDCMTTFLTDTDVVARPIRIFGGLPDDYNPIAACKSYVERLRAAGADVELTVYPNAAHAFDNPLGAQPATLQPRFQSARNCRIQEQEDGLLVNSDTGQPFAYTDACVAHGVHTGHDPVATRQAQLAVKDLLKKVFQLH
jgi:dienelactone hydrolase